MRARSLVSGGLLLGLVTTASLPASAGGGGGVDQVSALRYEIVERSHVIDMKVDRGLATLVVQRTVENRGPKSDQATFFLDIPESAVATRLRTAGVDSSGRPIWFEGELMEAEAAAKKYRELTGIGGYYPKDPALLSWRHRGLLALQVFPVPARSTKTVEYTLKVPLEYKDGAYRVELPALGSDAMKATVRVSTVHPEDGIKLNGVRPPPAPASVTADRTLAIELEPHGVSRLDGIVASVPIAEGKHLVRARIAAAPKLAEAPRGAHVVVLFDNSRSMDHRDEGLAAVRAYLGHMNGAVVDFLAFDREVRAPIGRNVAVNDALSRLSSLTLEAKNGSRLDDALAKADTILQTSPALARRVLVVTDTMMRSELTAVRVGTTSWQSNAVLHLAVVSGGVPRLDRDDESPWATLPRKTGGLFWNASAPSTIDPTTRTVFEEWARPKRIDKLVVKGLPEDYAALATLDEGQAIEHFTVAGVGAPRIELTGELWSRPFNASYTPTDEQGKLASALVFGTDLFGQLSEPEQMVLAMRGGAVSPVTSYLAIEPGVRPSNEGLDWGSIGSGFGTGSGQGFGMGHGRLGGAHSTRAMDREAFLKKELGAAARTCGLAAGGAAKSLSLALETTRIEIVDIGAVQTSPARDKKSEDCVREAMWAVMLPGDFKLDFDTYSVSVDL